MTRQLKWTQLFHATKEKAFPIPYPLNVHPLTQDIFLQKKKKTKDKFACKHSTEHISVYVLNAPAAASCWTPGNDPDKEKGIHKENPTASIPL